MLSDWGLSHQDMGSFPDDDPPPNDKKLISDLLAVVQAYEQWEADLILDQEAWRGGEAELPTLTEPLWDRLLEIQQQRNAVIRQVTKE